ncbi:YidB family protein [Devosia submarina]|uniref:YidB family protein n=1 Tax=Devosia submarina TaxID=1173082 RepID=UPI000D38DC30|nr:YidB family protein [Devosia submarina]
MARGTPSMMALLGLLAVAGYQNRDKLGSMLGSLGNAGGADGSGQPGQAGQDAGGLGGSGGLGGLLGGVLGGAGAGAGGAGGMGGGLGSILSGGLGDLLEQFNGAGQEQKARSWIGTGDNEPIDPSDLERTLGEDTIGELQEKTGLSRQELLDRLSRTLPDAVNQFTPDGRIPSETEASRFL